MRLKIVKIVTVCLITLAVISPGMVVLGVVWKQHLALERIQPLSCQVSQSSLANLALASQKKVTVLEQAETSKQFLNLDLVDQFLSVITQDSFARMLQFLILLIPIVLGIFTFCYDRYLVYRANVFQQQVERLEKLWQQSIEQ